MPMLMKYMYPLKQVLVILIDVNMFYQVAYLLLIVVLMMILMLKIDPEQGCRMLLKLHACLKTFTHARYYPK